MVVARSTSTRNEPTRTDNLEIIEMRKALPDREAMIRSAETAPILDWLRKNIHQEGRLYSAPDLIERATGEAPSGTPLLDYLEAKFSELYAL